MDIVSGIGAVTSALGIAKTLRGIEKTYDEATYKAQVADLINALTDAKLAMAEAKEDLAGKDKEIERLKASFEQRGNLYDGPGDYKFFTGDDGMPRGYPICPHCEAKEGRIVQLKQDNVIIQAKCPVCSNVFRPVECFVPQSAGGPTTLRKMDEQRREQESARASAALRNYGRTLA